MLLCLTATILLLMLMNGISPKLQNERKQKLRIWNIWKAAFAQTKIGLSCCILRYLPSNQNKLSCLCSQILFVLRGRWHNQYWVVSYSMGLRQSFLESFVSQSHLNFRHRLVQASSFCIRISLQISPKALVKHIYRVCLEF